MDPSDLIKQALAKREFWADLPAERKLRVRLRRPAPMELFDYLSNRSMLQRVERLCECAVGWEGFTEATILGDMHGSDSTLEFAPELLDLYLREHPSDFAVLQKAMSDAIRADADQLEAVAKNLKRSLMA
jgi:hypothetical protein